MLMSPWRGAARACRRWVRTPGRSPPWRGWRRWRAMDVGCSDGGVAMDHGCHTCLAKLGWRVRRNAAVFVRWASSAAVGAGSETRPQPCGAAGRCALAGSVRQEDGYVVPGSFEVRCARMRDFRLATFSTTCGVETGGTFPCRARGAEDRRFESRASSEVDASAGRSVHRGRYRGMRRVPRGACAPRPGAGALRSARAALTRDRVEGERTRQRSPPRRCRR